MHRRRSKTFRASESENYTYTQFKNELYKEWIFAVEMLFQQHLYMFVGGFVFFKATLRWIFKGVARYQEVSL